MPAAYVICLSMCVQGQLEKPGKFMPLQRCHKWKSLHGMLLKPTISKDKFTDLFFFWLIGWFLLCFWGFLVGFLCVWLVGFCYWEHKIPGVTYYFKQKGYRRENKTCCSSSRAVTKWQIINPTSVYCWEQQELQMFDCIITV